ncbi:28S ribosomal protein S30, mitochondrial [Varanus komodoensis]|uniref:Mitochondrial ribosomal protein S30 n=1 Tax=Varanus komodoensis TaxID=61221 RepID=A0A8D2IYC3_VARKO|nr:39S ribosomal protein S30, mitochondrial [Varanus komodoensis]KAF7250639.1 28S ribosomal protein S30, mitochondrial [Varanus komodoensis]
MAASGGRRWLCSARPWRLLHTEPSAAAPPPSLPSDTAAVEAAAPSSLYPPVVASLTAKSHAAKLRRRERFYQQIHDAPSVQEKLRLYGKRQRLKYVVYPQTWALNADRWYQNFTKTVFVRGLPAPVAAAEAAKEDSRDGIGGLDLAELRSVVCDVLLQEHFYQCKRRPYLFRTVEVGPEPFLTNLVPTLISHLVSANPMLGTSSTLDFKPDVNFYWMRGETVVPCGHRKGRIDPLRFQIDDKPHCQIRIKKQLSEFMPLDYISPEEIPHLKVLPDKLPLFKRQYYNKIFIGSRIADPCTYGHTQFHLLPERLKRERLIKLNLIDQLEVPSRANAIASLFAWTGAQAMYQGFWSEADVTRPFVAQAVITDGRYFAFFCYQLNTLALTVDADKNNPRKNICWGTESQPLYEALEDNDVKGFNDEVLVQLITFLLNRPKEE